MFRAKFSRQIVLALITLVPAEVFALGFRIIDQSADATARGNAFVATADDPSAIYYNPAGITQLEGTRALLGAYTISLKTTVTLDGTEDHNHFHSSNVGLQAVPQSYTTWQPKNSPVTFGLGTYSPFGFAVEYPDDTPFRTLAHKGSLRFLTVNPVIAWKICDTLSVAAGGEINSGRAELNRGIIAPGDYFIFKGDGVSGGFNAGILWDPHPAFHIGLNYHSAGRMNFRGYTTYRTDPIDVSTPAGPYRIPGATDRQGASAAFNLPETVSGGISFRPTKDWNFEFDVDWTDWHNLKTVTLHQQRDGDVFLPFNWQSSMIYEFGVTKKFANNFHVSAGYIYSETSVPNDSFSPAVPDSNRHVFDVGIGQRTDRFSWALAYQYTFGPDRHVSQGTLADGSYRFDSHAFTLSLGYNF